MDNNEKIKIIDRVLRELNGMVVSGVRNCGRLYNAASELERLRWMLESDEEFAEDAAESEETEA